MSVNDEDQVAKRRWAWFWIFTSLQHTVHSIFASAGAEAEGAEAIGRTVDAAVHRVAGGMASARDKVRLFRHFVLAVVHRWGRDAGP